MRQQPTASGSNTITIEPERSSTQPPLVLRLRNPENINRDRDPADTQGRSIVRDQIHPLPLQPRNDELGSSATASSDRSPESDSNEPIQYPKESRAHQRTMAKAKRSQDVGHLFSQTTGIYVSPEDQAEVQRDFARGTRMMDVYHRMHPPVAPEPTPEEGDYQFSSIVDEYTMRDIVQDRKDRKDVNRSIVPGCPRTW